MSRRIVLGVRNNGDSGLFIAPPGVDAYTAADASLTLNVTSKISQLLLMGRAGTNGTVVALGLSRAPYVFLTSNFDFSNVVNHTLGPGPMRPSPPFLTGVTPSTATINGNGSSMTIGLSSYTAIYEVYSQAFT